MRIVVAITGATGVIYGIRFLEILKKENIETHLILSKWGKANIELETQYSVSQVEQLASQVYDEGNLAASISSGSFIHNGMVVIPCSMKTLSAIAHGYDDTLISRAADVCLKEGRKLILCVRETPLNAIQLQNMLTLSQLGVVIMPPVPSFYNNPVSIDDLIRNYIARVLDQMSIKNDLIKRWDGNR